GSIGLCCNNTSYVGSVAIIVGRVIVGVYIIGASQHLSGAIKLLVDAAANIETSIDDGHNDAGSRVGIQPAFGCVNLLRSVLKTRSRGIKGIGWRQICVVDKIGLDDKIAG